MADPKLSVLAHCQIPGPPSPFHLLSPLLACTKCVAFAQFDTGGECKDWKNLKIYACRQTRRANAGVALPRVIDA